MQGRAADCIYKTATSDETQIQYKKHVVLYLRFVCDMMNKLYNVLGL